MPTPRPAPPRAVATRPSSGSIGERGAGSSREESSGHRPRGPRPRRRPRGHSGSADGAQVLGREILIQHTVLTGFRHHAAPRLWAALGPDARLSLVREPDNPEDPRAVALYWRGQKIGYLPRGENLVVAALLDRKRNLSARIEHLRPDAERNQRIAIRVLLH